MRVILSGDETMEDLEGREVDLEEGRETAAVTAAAIVAETEEAGGGGGSGGRRVLQE